MPRYDDRPGPLRILFRFLLVCLGLALAGFVLFAFFGDLAAPVTPRSQPVQLDG
jgi:hypothetical protein